MNRTTATIIVIMMMLTVPAFAESFTGRIVSVVDANNIIVTKQLETVRVRFVGIECPELDQPFGTQAKQLITNLLLGKEIWVDVKGLDHDKRLLSIVMADGKNVALELIRAGLAWNDSKFHFFKNLAEAEKEAQAKHIGLWACSDSTHPGVYRQKRRGIIPLAGAPCHSGASEYGLIEASDHRDYTDYGSIGSPGGYYFYDYYFDNNYLNNYSYPYYYRGGCNRAYTGSFNSPVISAPASVLDRSFVQSQRSVLDTSYMKGQHSVLDR